MPFIILLLFLAGCETPNRFVWDKNGASQDDFSRYNYLCLQESQQRVSEVNGATQWLAGHAESKVVTNQTLFNACMNAHGWYLKLLENN